MIDDILTADEAAAYLKISRRAFDRLSLDRCYVGRLPRWRRSTIDAYLCTTMAAATPKARTKRAPMKLHTIADIERLCGSTQPPGEPIPGHGARRAS